ncbi:MAG: hypothetical protein KAG34_08915 [Cocleimonas sp.]|nr:hypothetical protein [Cocleimonas sp.]
MRNKNYIALMGVVLITQQGCMANGDKKETDFQGGINTVSPPKQSKDHEFIQKLADLNQRNPVADAQQAIASGDKKFIAKAGRGLNIPSIDVNTYSMLKGQCGLRYERGFGDQLYGQYHRRFYSAFVAYAERYNQTMLSACQD